MEKIKYGGWDNCYRINNGMIDLIITADVGPRLIRLGFIKQKNFFKEFPEQIGKTSSDQWLAFGGHRLWHAPESKNRTYFPDFEPVHIQETNHGLIATQKPEPITGLQKQIEIKIEKDKPGLNLTHKLINHNLWSIETAPWAISVLNPGGTAVLPFPPRGTHPEYLLPSSSIILWPYTDLSDDRFIFGERMLLVRQDRNAYSPQKIGISTSVGWSAYANQNQLFIKQVPIQFDAVYPDLGSHFEVFTNDEMLELESLGPFSSIPPKGQITHQEHWSLVEGIPAPKTEEDVVKHILPHL